MIVGIGLSGPQIVEGWYGQPWGKPNARLRDYVEILRDVLRREGPVTHDGPEISLPFTGPGALGQGKPLKTILHAPSDIPIWLASVGPKNTALCAELCDGWLPMGLPPRGTDDPDVAAALAWRDYMVSDYSDAGQERWLADNGITLLRGEGRLAGTGVTSPTHSDDSCGVSTGTFAMTRGVSPATSAYRRIISA